MVAVPVHENTEPWVPADTFGARLALIRQHLGGWNVARVAAHCRLDDQSWRNWEKHPDKGPRNYETVTAQIAAAVNCNVAWLRAGGPLDTGARDLQIKSLLLYAVELAALPDEDIPPAQLTLDLYEEHARSFSLAL